jgi:hypothetical protein
MRSASVGPYSMTSRGAVASRTNAANREAGCLAAWPL